MAGGSKRTRQTESTATSAIIRSLEQGGEYSFSMVSTNNMINSTKIGPINISLGIIICYNHIIIVTTTWFSDVEVPLKVTLVGIYYTFPIFII